MDGLLRMLRGRLPAATPRAYADDTAIVATSLRADLVELAQIFDLLRRASNLTLHVGKTVLIPLGDRQEESIRQELVADGHPWQDMYISSSAKYLGFLVGPGKADRSWDKPLKKFRERVAHWPWTEIGLFYATQVWNTFVLPVLLFVAQLERVPEVVLQTERCLLRRAAPGPGSWCQAEDLWRLRKAFHLPGEFRQLSATAIASHLRVLHFENRQAGGLRIQHRARVLEGLLSSSEYLVRKARWGGWYQRSALFVLHAAARQFRGLGFTRTAIEDLAAGNATRPWTPAVASQVRHNFQRAACAVWAERQGWISPEGRLRHKLGLRGFRDRRHMTRCLERLRQVGQRSLPRVAAAAFGCIWNRWGTARRMQRRGSACLLGCGRGEDSVEHYCTCSITKEFGDASVAIQYRFSPPLEHWFFVAPQCVDSEEDSWYLRVAALQYSVLRTTNAARHRGAPLSATDARRALRQALVEGVRGHALAGQIRRVQIARSRQ